MKDECHIKVRNDINSLSQDTAQLVSVSGLCLVKPLP